MANAPEALGLYADVLAEDGRSVPPARTLTCATIGSPSPRSSRRAFAPRLSYAFPFLL